MMVVIASLLVLVCLAGAEASAQSVTVLHSFQVTDGRSAGQLMQASDGFLYGTTSDDASSVFRLDRNGGNFETIHSFTDVEEEGEHPMAPLMEGTDGFLYGTTYVGGQYSAGTAFKLRKDGAAFEVSVTLHPARRFTFSMELERSRPDPA